MMAAQHVEPLYLFPPKSGADPGFPVGGLADPLGGTTEDDKFYLRGRCFNPSGVSIPWEILAAPLVFSLFGGFDEKV